MRSRVLFLLLCLPICSALSESVPSLKERIHRVENELSTPVVLKGEKNNRRNLLREMRERGVPAVSVAVVHNGRIEWAKAYGDTLQNGSHVSPSTLFQAASISKSVSATGALHLVDQGKLSLDAPIETELTSWTLPKSSFTKTHPVTLRELLSHTAGISVHGFAGYPAGSPVPTLIQALQGQPPANSAPVVVIAVPGEAYSYSGGGFLIVQQAITDSAGVPFEQYMKSAVLDPIGMVHSLYQQPLAASLRQNAAMPAGKDGKPTAGGPHVYPELAPAGLWTTPSDLALWMIEIQRSLMGSGHSVLSPAMAREMLTRVKNDYGLGVGVQDSSGKRSFSHSGGNEGYRTYYFCYENGDGAVVMTNSDNGADLMMEVVRSIAGVYKWPDFKLVKRTAITVPLQSQTQYIGRYSLQDIGRFDIRAGSGHLELILNGDTPRQLYSASSKALFTTSIDTQINFDSANVGTFLLGNERFRFQREP